MPPLTLPALTVPAAIDAENVLAAGVIYAACELEQLRLFAVADRIVELYQQGLLTVGANAGNRLAKYWTNGPSRLSEQERHVVYARTLGLGDAVPSVESNEEFPRLWQRFVASVASPGRGSRMRAQPAVRRAGRDLAANLSLHGHGIGYFAASRLRSHLTDAIALLSLPDIRAAYGARDMWQVVDAVSASELGGARNVSRHRTLASNGLVIVRWLAGLGRPRPRGATIPPYPELVKASEAWIAAAVSDDT